MVELSQFNRQSVIAELELVEYVEPPFTANVELLPASAFIAAGEGVLLVVLVRLGPLFTFNEEATPAIWYRALLLMFRGFRLLSVPIGLTLELVDNCVLEARGTLVGLSVEFRLLGLLRNACPNP